MSSKLYDKNLMLIKQQELLLKQQIIDLYQHQDATLSLRQQDIDNLIEKHFPSRDELAHLLLDINQLANNNHVTVISIIPQESETMEHEYAGSSLNKLKVQRVALTASAKYLDVMNLIAKLIVMQHTIEIESLEIVHGSQNLPSQLTVFMQLKMYFLE